MTKEQVVYLRELYGEDNLEVFLDNALLFSSKLANTHIIWDDDRELVHVINTEQRYTHQNSKPVAIRTNTYDCIQSINTCESIQDFEPILDKLIADSKSANIDKEAILNSFRVLGKAR